MTKQWLAKIEQQQHDGTYQKPVLLPESLYVVRVNEEAVSCTDPEGRLEMVMWNDLQRVEIQTNALGPALPDLFWVLIGSSRVARCLWDCSPHAPSEDSGDKRP